MFRVALATKILPDQSVSVSHGPIKYRIQFSPFRVEIYNMEDSAHDQDDILLPRRRQV